MQGVNELFHFTHQDGDVVKGKSVLFARDGLYNSEPEDNQDPIGYVNINDLTFIAHARSDIPNLVAEIERLRGICKALGEEEDYHNSKLD